nr:ribonuclease H-like domain-containing protein [Tanacetum cinerariifolium]
MRMEQYLTHTNYALWEVIVNGDAPASIASVSGSAETAIPPKATAEKIARRNELKVKSTLLLAIPDNTSSLNEAVNTDQNGFAASLQGQASILTYADDVMFFFFATQSNSLQLDNEDLEQIDTDDLEKMDLKWQVSMLTIRVKRFIKKTRRNLNFNGKEPVRFDKTKVECYNCHRRGHFTKDCRAPRSQRNRNGDNTRRVVPVETPATALVLSQLNERDINNKSDVFESASDSSVNEIKEDNNQANDRYKAGEGYHEVPPPYIGNFIPSRPDLSFAELYDFVFKSAIIKNVNDDVRLQDLVDGKKVIVNEASIRCDLRLDDAEGTAYLPNAAIFEELARMRKHKSRRKQRKETKVPQTKLQAEEHIHTPSYDPLPSVKKRVKKLEGKKKKKRTHRLKRLYKVGLSARVESSEDEKGLGAQEDASKQGKIAEIDVAEDLFLIDDNAQDQGRK